MTTLREYACFASGVGAGVAIAVLFAPKSGLHTRNQIREKVQKGTSALKRGKAAAGEAIDRELEGVQAAYEAGKQAYRDTTERGYQGGTAGQPG